MQALHRLISRACLFKYVVICGSVCVRAAVFSCKCVSRLYGQVTHRCDPFSASPDPRPQPLCLLWMCPLCLVPYPIILCPCSKSPCLSIVLLTCSIFPIGHNTLIVSLHLWPSFLRFFLSIFPSGVLYFHLFLSLHLPAFFFSIHFYVTLNTFFHLHVSTSFCELHYILRLLYSPFSMYLYLYSLFTLMG